MAEIDEKLLGELTNAIKSLEAANREQKEAVGDIIRKMNNPSYQGGSFSSFGGSNLAGDLVSKMFEKLSKRMEALGGNTQTGSAGGGRLSGAASTVENNPAANAAKQARANANAGAGGGTTAPAGQSSAHASTPSNPNPAARAADFFSRLSQQGPNAMNVGSRYASDFSRSVIQPARKFGAFQTNMNYAGELQGLSGAGGDISIGPFGMRTPFNAAFGRGLQMKFDAFKDSMGAGITMGQAENIQNTLTGAGYNYGDPQFNRLKGMFQTGTRINSAIAQDPRFQEMAISGTRMGGASMEDMLESLNAIKDTAGNIHVSVGQMLEDSKQYGKLLQGSGGNSAMGMKMAAQMGAITGLPGQTTLALQNNPFVQARQMQATGLMPWQLGQMSAAQRANTTYQSFDMLTKQLGSSGPTTSYMDAGGFRHISTGLDKSDATLAMMMGVDVNTIKQMRKNRGHVMARARAQDAFEGYTETGNRILSDSHLSNAQKMAKLNAMGINGGRGTLGALKQQMKAAGASAQDIAKVMSAPGGPAGSSGHAIVGRAEARSKAFSDWASKQSGKETGASNMPKVWIGLNKDAKKLLNVQSSQNGKAAAGAGVGTVIGGALGALSMTPFGSVAGAALGGVIGEAASEVF